MKRIALILLVAGLLLQTACSRQKHGLVMMTDESYRPRIIATSKTGFGSPDGLVGGTATCISPTKVASHSLV